MPIRRPSSRPVVEDRYEDEDEITPVVTRSRRPVEDDDEEEAPRARRRRPVEDDEDDEPPVRRKTRAAVEEDDDYEEEDEDEEAPRSARVAAGWGAAKALAAEGGDYANEFKLDAEEQIIAFLDDAPFSSYRQHFIREKEGKKSFICLGKGCPLCDDLGHSPDKKFAFNVVDLGGDEPVVKMLVAGPRLLGIIEKAHEGKYGPINKPYWSIARVGSGQKTSYTLTVVKERDLAEDWDLDPAEVKKAVASLEGYTADIIKMSTKGELRMVVADLD